MTLEGSYEPLRHGHQPSLWCQFEDQRHVFWDLVKKAEGLSDVQLAGLSQYNAFLKYGVGLTFVGGTQACKVIGLALIQGHPDPDRAATALDRFWYGLLPDSYASGSRPRH